MLAGWVERSLRLKAPASSDLMIRRSTNSGERHARNLVLPQFAVVFFVTFSALSLPAALHSAAGFHDNIRYKHCTPSELRDLKRYDRCVGPIDRSTGKSLSDFPSCYAVCVLETRAQTICSCCDLWVGLKHNLGSFRFGSSKARLSLRV